MRIVTSAIDLNACPNQNILFGEKNSAVSANLGRHCLEPRVPLPFLEWKYLNFFFKKHFFKKFKQKIIREMRRHWTDFHLFKYSNEHLTGNILHFFFFKKKKNLISVESPSASFEHQPNNIGILFLMN